MSYRAHSDIGPRLAPYFFDSFRQAPAGWRLAFDPRDMVASQSCLNGDHWKDWLATDCPALVIRGRDSRVIRSLLSKKWLRGDPILDWRF
jgi:pimeloyl-ACP methyl ester carboxylesterase